MCVGESTDEGQGYVTRILAEGCLHRIAAILDSGKRRFGKREERPARVGQAHAPAHALEQRHAELMLDQPDPTADRRLRAMQLLGCAREPAKLRDRQKRADALDIHGDA